mgnify:CR=1 FL=1
MINIIIRRFIFIEFSCCQNQRFIWYPGNAFDRESFTKMRLICSPEYRKYAFTEKLYYLEELETTSLSNYKSTYNKKMSVSLFRLRFIKKYMVSCSIHGNFSLLNEVKSQKGGIHGLHNN